MSSRGWVETDLNAIAIKITKGTTPKVFTEQGISYYKAQCVTSSKYLDKSVQVFIDEETNEKLKRSQLKANDILFSMAGMFLGKTCIVRETDLPANINQALALIRLNEESADADYVYYYLNQKHVVELVNNMTSQSAQPNINLKQIGELKIKLPELQEQKAIATVLSIMDEKIELNNEIKKTLEMMAVAIFKGWFVDFEFPNENGESYKSQNGHFIESDLGIIPEGWNVLEMGQFLHAKSKRVGELEITEYSTTNTGIQLRNEKFKKNLSKSSAKNKVIEKNDIVFGMSREILNFGVMKDELGAVSPAYHVFSVDCHVYDAELLELYMRIRDKYFLDLIKPGSREGQGLDKEHLSRKKVIVPSKEIQTKFNCVYSIIKCKIESINNQTKTLIEMRDSLLPKLMSGEIRISEVEQGMETCLQKNN